MVSVVVPQRWAASLTVRLGASNVSNIVIKQSPRKCRRELIGGIELAINRGAVQQHSLAILQDWEREWGGCEAGGERITARA
jgi:hypothetical protein